MMRTLSRLPLAGISVLALVTIPLLAPPAPAQKVPDIRLDTGTPPGTASSTNLAIAAAGDGVFVVWVDNRNGQNDLFFNRSLDAGTTWLPAAFPVDHAPADALACTPDLAVVGSSVYVSWMDWRNNAITPDVTTTWPSGCSPTGRGRRGRGAWRPSCRAPGRR